MKKHQKSKDAHKGRRFLENSVAELYKLFERHRKYPNSFSLADLKEKSAILLADKCRLSFRNGYNTGSAPMREAAEEVKRKKKN